ncbi:MAG: SEC-C domain-containing protein, partial [Clostridia bacterium]|nr:SEC-C domain-containing protein [Clostridia bacterium]
MSLYSEWQDRADALNTPQEQQLYWGNYFDKETENYKKILSDPSKLYEGTLADLAKEFDMDDVTFTGFIDGINTSLKEEIDLDSLTSESNVKLDVDLEKLYFNMLEAKAEWLYTLPEWDPILTVERRKEITKEHRASKIFVKEETVGRNDPCPCGSGK